MTSNQRNHHCLVPDLKFFLKISGVVTLLSVAATLLIDPIWGFYDSFMAMLASDRVSGVYINESYHLGLNPMVKLLGALHRIMPSLPWTGLLLMLIWVYLQTISIFVISLSLSIREFSFKVTSYLWLALLTFVFGFSFIEYSITGIAILISFISLIAIGRVHNSLLSASWKWSLTVILSVGFIAGFCLRIESGLGGALLGILFILMTERSLGTLVRVFVLPGLLSLLFLFRYYETLNENYFFKNIDPIVFYVTDSQNKVPFKGDDSIEELKIKLIKASFLIDSTQFNYAMYNKLAQQKWQYEKDYKLRPYESVVQVMRVAGPTVYDNLALSLVYLIALLIALLTTFYSERRDTFYPILFFNIAFGLIICFLAYSMKMEKWHYVPLVQCAILSNVFYLLSKLNFEKYRHGIVVQVLFGAMAVVLFTSEIRRIRENHMGIDEKLNIADGMFARQDKQLIFLDVNTREILDNYVFRSYQKRNDVYFYDIAQFAYLPEYEMRLNDLCHCNAHSAKDFFMFLNKNASRIDYYSTPARVALLSDFMRKVCGTKVVFRPKAETQLKDNSYGLESIVLYRLEFPE